jgi:hypothetical protein
MPKKSTKTHHYSCGLSQCRVELKKRAEIGGGIKGKGGFSQFFIVVEVWGRELFPKHDF